MNSRPVTATAMVLAALATAARAGGQPAAPVEGAVATNAAPAATQLPETVVTGRQDGLLGVANSASEGTVGRKELDDRTLSRAGEVLETVPGLIVTQHSGGGKANQYFLRGFNLDHGTDFATMIDGVPVNLPSHAHGQGYTDLNFMAPELIDRLDYRKGVYYADLGDFSSAGAADIHYFNAMPSGLAQIEAGSFGFARGVFAASTSAGAGTVLYAAELSREDGPWVHPDDYTKLNGVLRYSQGDAARGFSVTAMGYGGEWNGTDQIALRAAGAGGLGLYDSLDPSDGGNSHRYSVSAEWHRADNDSETKLLFYGVRYDLDLYSDFTYFLDSPQGDQIEQQDGRWTGGAKASQTWFGHLADKETENTIGLQLRSDSIDNGLYQTVDRQRGDKLSWSGGALPATTRLDQIWEASLSPYFENKFQWAEKVRSVAGVRADYYHFDVTDLLPANSGTRDAFLASPKGSLIFGPWAKTEFYLGAGLGFHSNDGRGATSRVDPATGNPIQPADPLVRSYGAEIGIRSTTIPGLQSTLSFWWLDIDSELVFDGDAGTTAPSAPSRRCGVELANYYPLNPWLALDADFSLSRAKFTQTVFDESTGLSGDSIPEAVNMVISTGVSFHQPGERGFFGELRLRFFGPRPLAVDDSVQSGATALLSAKAGYRFGKHWSASVEGFNLLDRKDHEIDYYYASRLESEPAGPVGGGYDDLHFKPVEPIMLRAALTARF